MPIPIGGARHFLSQSLTGAAHLVTDPNEPIPFEVAPNMASILFTMPAREPTSGRKLKVFVMAAVSENEQRIEELLEGARPLVK